MDIELSQILALLVMQQNPETFFIPKEDFNIDTSNLALALDYDEEREGVVIFLVEKDEIQYDDESE